MEAHQYFLNKRLPNWRLEKNGKLVDSYSGEDFSQSEKELTETLELLSPGSYVLKVWEKKHGEAAQKQFEFDVKKTSKFTGMPSTVATQNGGIDVDAIRREEREKVLLMVKLDRLQESYDILNKNVEAIQKQLAELLGQPETEPDVDPVEKFAKVAKHGTDIFGMIKNLNLGTK